MRIAFLFAILCMGCFSPSKPSINATTYTTNNYIRITGDNEQTDKFSDLVQIVITDSFLTIVSNPLNIHYFRTKTINDTIENQNLYFVDPNADTLDYNGVLFIDKNKHEIQYVTDEYVYIYVNCVKNTQKK